jgi:aspartate carbamoyltransferase regulatory subunit
MSRPDQDIGEKFTLNQNRTLGGYYCPTCLKLSLCQCKNCISINSKNTDFKLVGYSDDYELLICPYCNEKFHPDESLEIEYQKYKKGNI